MPYDRRHVVIQWGGTLPGGEIWSNMVRGGSTQTGPSASVPTHQELIDWLNGEMKDEVSAYHARSSTLTHSSAKLAWVKANVVGMDGRYVEQTTNEYRYPTPIAGTLSSNLHPNQVCLVVSLTTAFKRGLAHRGRYYLPLPAPAIGSTTGTISTSDALGVATSTKTFIEALADTPGLDNLIPFKVLVMSKRGAGGATNPVTGVEVGVVLDTQRRRRAAMLEAYQVATIDQGAE